MPGRRFPMVSAWEVALTDWKRYRLWLGAGLAAAAISAAFTAVAMPFLDLSAGETAGYVTGLLILAEILAAAALLVLGKDLYQALRSKLESLKSSLEDP